MDTGRTSTLVSLVGRNLEFLKKIFSHLIKDSKNEYLSIDSTIVRAHQHSSGAKKKQKKRRLWDTPEEV